MGSLKKTAHCSNFQKIRFTAEKQQIKKFKFWGLSPLFKFQQKPFALLIMTENVAQ